MRFMPWIAALVAIAAPAALHAQEARPRPARIQIKEEYPGLAARAKISGDSAIALARATVPHGRITSAELEEEHGHLIYSFDIRVASQQGITEVHVDAITGAVAPLEHEAGGEEGAEATPYTYAQRLVDRMVARHADLSNLELAVLSDSTCATVAATERQADVGEACDADEYGPIRTGEPNVERPTKDDPIYDITLALHDASGHLIGAVGMDIAPPKAGGDSAAVARARALLRELEAQIPSQAKLYERVPAERPGPRGGGRD
jgi:hypothetical protein